MIKRILLFAVLLLTFGSQCFAAAISKDANVAVMDFGTRPGATIMQSIHPASI